MGYQGSRRLHREGGGMLSDCEMERGRGGGEGRCPYGVGEADSM